jgi:hypothetical protein
VAVVHDVVVQACPETYADGVMSTAPEPPKAEPKMVSVLPPETWVLSGRKEVAAKHTLGEPHEGFWVRNAVPHAQ